MALEISSVSRKDNAPVSIRIRLKYPDLDTFVEKYAANISQGGMFIQSRAPQPVATHLRFEVLLADDARLLKGEGKVIWVREYDAAHPTRVHGMGVKFLELDSESQSMVNLVLAHKGGRISGPRKKSPTQEVQGLVREALTEDDAPDEEKAEPEAEVQNLAQDEPQERPEEPAAEEPVQPREPAVAMAVLDAGGGDVALALAAADADLEALMREANLTEDQVMATLSRTLATTSLDHLEDELQQLIDLEPPPLMEPLQAMEILQRSLGARQVTKVARWEAPPLVAPATPKTSATPKTPPTPPPGADDQPPDPQDLDRAVGFDPRLLEAAAHVSRAHAAEHSEQSFDLSEASQPEMGDMDLSAVKDTAGWNNLRTATSWLDHDSSEDMAAGSSADSRDDGYHEGFGDMGEDEIEEAVTVPHLLEGDPASELSSEMWREVVQEASDLSDPGRTVSGDPPELDEEMVEEDLFVAKEDHTQVSAAPPDFHIRPTPFEEQRDLLPTDNLFPFDPDLNNEVFDDLAGVNKPSPEDEDPIAWSTSDIPSLDDLAEVAHQSVPSSPGTRTPTGMEMLQIIADDPEPEDVLPGADIKPRKSGILRRLFGKKKEE